MNIGRIVMLAGMLALGACTLSVPDTPNAFEVFFPTDSAELQPEANEVLDTVAKIARGDKALARVQVLGYADSAGEPLYNVALSERRAGVVERALVGRGVAARRIDAKGMGPDDKLEDEVASRRVQIRFVGP